MPFSAGVYTVAIDFSTEATSPPIPIADLDTQFADMATAFDNCILRDGTGLPTAAIPFNGQDVTGMNSLTISNALSDANTLILSKTGSKIVIARSSGGGNFVLGSDSIGGSTFSLKNAGGVTTELQLGPSAATLKTNALTRFSIASTGAVTLNGADSGNTLTVASDNVIQSHGNLLTGLTFTTTANFGIFVGQDVPTISAAKGSLYLRSNGSGATDRAYIATDSAGTWTAITTVA
jgi:hypothetical protein